MGNCLSGHDASEGGNNPYDGPGKEGRDRSYAIDRQIEQDSKQFRKECKILLLGECCSCWDDTSVLTSSLRSFFAGSGESGKSTVVKQMKIIHQNGYSRDELMLFRITVFKSLLTLSAFLRVPIQACADSLHLSSQTFSNL